MEVIDVDKEFDLEFENMIARKIEQGAMTHWNPEEMEKEKLRYRRSVVGDKREYERILKIMKVTRVAYGVKRRTLEEVLSMPPQVLEAKRQFQDSQEQANQYATMALATMKVEYELVDAWASLSFRDINLPGRYVHLNLRAKPKSALSTDPPEQQKLFFAELKVFRDPEKYPEIFSVLELQGSGDSVGGADPDEGHDDAIVRGCRFCKADATRPIYHPVGRFRAGVPFKYASVLR